MTLHQPRQRRHQRIRHPPNQLRAQQHRLHIPRRMVISKNRPRQTPRRPRRVQIPRRRENRVNRVIRIRIPRPRRIHPPHLPRRRQKLHPPHRPSRRHTQIPPIISLNLINRRQHLPRHVILNPRRLINRQQKRRNRKTRNKEIRHTQRRRIRRRKTVRRVARGRHTARRTRWRGRRVGARGGRV